MDSFVNSPEYVMSQFVDGNYRLQRVSHGNINKTYLVYEQGNEYPFAVLQMMHSIFSKDLLSDFTMVSDALIDKGYKAPKLIYTKNDDYCYTDHSSRLWRLMNYISGVSYNIFPSKRHVYSAAVFIGKLHHDLNSEKFNFKHRLNGFHDFDFYKNNLKKALLNYRDHQHFNLINELSIKILLEPPKDYLWSTLPLRISHGDLKVSNFLFDTTGVTCKTLIDFDTWGHRHLAIELGDALRSWCVSTSEDSVSVEVSQESFSSAIEGYLIGAREWITKEEYLSILPGMLHITLELAIRFACDALEEKYFDWDSHSYASLSEHNYKRASTQYNLYLEMKNNYLGFEKEILNTWNNAL